MGYIIGSDRNQINMIMASLDEMIDVENPVRVIDSYVDSLDLSALGFNEYDGNRNKKES